MSVRLPLQQWERFLESDDTTLGRRYVAAVLLLGALLAGAALVGVCWAAGWTPVWRVVREADWPLVLVAPIAILVSHAGYSLAYREVTRAGKGPELEGEEAVAMVTTGFGPFSPRGGFALDATAMRNLGMTRDEAALRVRILGMLEYAVLAPIAFVAALDLWLNGAKAQSGLLPSWVIGVPAGAAVALALIAWFRRSGRPSSWWSPVRNSIQAVEETIGLLRSWPAGPLAGAGMALYWAAEIGALAGCLAAFAHRRGVGAALVVGYATGYALTRRALPLAGAGVVEALMPFALTWVGYPLAEAILAVVAYRLFNLWFAVIPAAGGLRHMRRNQLRRRRRARRSGAPQRA